MHFLEQIVANKRQEVARARQARPLADVQAACAEMPRPRHFHRAVATERETGLHLIAGIKRASPWSGLIRDDFDPAAIARELADAGASAISVATDGAYFQGALEHIEAVRAAVDLPVLRNDFVIDEYQIYEARAAGADAVLLVGELITPQQLLDMLILANELKMTALVEMHEADTVMRFRSAVSFPLRHYNLLGINNRDLRTHRVDLSTTARLISLFDEDVPVVTQSGVRTRADVQRLRAAGARAMLVGEALMTAGDIGVKVRELLGA